MLIDTVFKNVDAVDKELRALDYRQRQDNYRLIANCPNSIAQEMLRHGPKGSKINKVGGYVLWTKGKSCEVRDPLHQDGDRLKCDAIIMAYLTDRAGLYLYSDKDTLSEIVPRNRNEGLIITGDQWHEGLEMARDDRLMIVLPVLL